MTPKKSFVSSEEPIGIVISRGRDADPAPTVLAFVWGPADVEMPDLAGV